MNLIWRMEKGQEWENGGVPFPGGRPESIDAMIGLRNGGGGWRFTNILRKYPRESPASYTFDRLAYYDFDFAGWLPFQYGSSNSDCFFLLTAWLTTSENKNPASAESARSSDTLPSHDEARFCSDFGTMICHECGAVVEIGECGNFLSVYILLRIRECVFPELAPLIPLSMNCLFSL